MKLKPTHTTFAVDPETAATLQGLAQPRCYRCNGSGIRRWRNRGRTAEVCSCAEREYAGRDPKPTVGPSGGYFAELRSPAMGFGVEEKRRPGIAVRQSTGFAAMLRSFLRRGLRS